MAKTTFLEFEQPIAELEAKIDELRFVQDDSAVDISEEIERLQREIARKGGKAAHAKGTAHEWTSEEAREAGRRGGMMSGRRAKAAAEREA